MGLWNWLKSLFVAPKPPLKQGPMPKEEMELAVIPAFQKVVMSGRFSGAVPDDDLRRDCSSAIMKEFMDACEYEMSPKDLVKAAKMCRQYVDMVFLDRYI